MKRFCEYHPLVLLIYFAFVIGIAMFVQNMLFQISALLGGIALFAKQKRGKKVGTWLYIVLFALIALTNPLFSHNGATPLFFLNGNPITLESLVYGASLGLMLLAVMIWFQCFGAVFTGERLLFLFGRMIPKTALVITVIMRFIPLFIRRIRKVGSAQRVLGLYYSSDWGDRLKGGCRVFLSVLSRSLEDAMETASSMRSKGYGVAKRTHFSLFRFRASDATLLLGCALLFSVVAVGLALGEADFEFYPTVCFDISAISVCAYCAYFVLCFLPFIIEIKEVILWRYCVSRI